jgi:hypothetical protein
MPAGAPSAKGRKAEGGRTKGALGSELRAAVGSTHKKIKNGTRKVRIQAGKRSSGTPVVDRYGRSQAKKRQGKNMGFFVKMELLIKLAFVN